MERQLRDLAQETELVYLCACCRHNLTGERAPLAGTGEGVEAPEVKGQTGAVSLAAQMCL